MKYVRKTAGGRGKDLTPAQRQEIVAWWALRQEVGSMKVKAGRMGITLRAMRGVLHHFKTHGGLFFASMGDRNASRIKR